MTTSMPNGVSSRRSPSEMASRAALLAEYALCTETPQHMSPTCAWSAFRQANPHIYVLVFMFQDLQDVQFCNTHAHCDGLPLDTSFGEFLEDTQRTHGERQGVGGVDRGNVEDLAGRAAEGQVCP